MADRLTLQQCSQCKEFDDVKNLSEIRSTDGKLLGYGCSKCVLDLIAYCHERNAPYRIERVE